MRQVTYAEAVGLFLACFALGYGIAAFKRFIVDAIWYAS